MRERERGRGGKQNKQTNDDLTVMERSHSCLHCWLTCAFVDYLATYLNALELERVQSWGPSLQEKISSI